jgi:integrase
MRKSKLYTIPAKCYVCGKDYMKRYNVGKRARVCTPPSHKCRRGMSGTKKLACVDRCCRSRYAIGSQANMGNSLDPRKFLSDEEFKAVVEASYKVPDPNGLAIRFLCVTGCRLSEMLSVMVGDFEWRDGEFSIVRIRTLKRDGHPIREVHLLNSSPITKELRISYAEKLKTEAPLFQVPRRTFQGWIQKILKKIKPNRINLAHIFRHTRASQLVRSGAPLTYVAHQLGWSNLEMIRNYSHTQESEIAGILGKIK